jgi:hypothetical protein
MFRPTVAIFRFPQTIKMSLYNLCEGEMMKRSVCINPLFALVSNVNRLYISNDYINPLNAELNPICHLLALLGGATIVVVSRLRVNRNA